MYSNSSAMARLPFRFGSDSWVISLRFQHSTEESRVPPPPSGVPEPRHAVSDTADRPASPLAPRSRPHRPRDRSDETADAVVARADQHLHEAGSFAAGLQAQHRIHRKLRHACGRALATEVALVQSDMGQRWVGEDAIR